MSPQFSPVPAASAIPLYVIEQDALDSWIAAQPDHVATWVQNAGFTGALGSTLIIPTADGSLSMALAGYGSARSRARGRFHLAAAATALPEADYRIEGLDPARVEEEALGWLLSSYAFDRYRAQSGAKARLVAPAGLDSGRIEAIAAGECLTRDLINTPAADMGPGALEAACTDLAAQFGPEIGVTYEDALLENNLPMIHAVGRAVGPDADQGPRLIDMRWGTDGPRLTLVGKGVCFDTGGLNLKPGGSMGLMKKDMGGAATVLGLARMIMALGLPLRLRVLIPAVENAVSGDAMRPGDILTARNGLTVEINNTDAEGRLVLADALTLGAEEDP